MFDMCEPPAAMKRLLEPIIEAMRCAKAVAPIRRHSHYSAKALMAGESRIVALNI